MRDKGVLPGPLNEDHWGTRTTDKSLRRGCQRAVPAGELLREQGGTSRKKGNPGKPNRRRVGAGGRKRRRPYLNLAVRRFQKRQGERERAGLY